MYYSKTFYEDTVVVKVVGSNKKEYYLSFEDIDFEEVINKIAGLKYDYATYSDIMYDMNIAIDDEDENGKDILPIYYEVVFCISQPEWVGCGEEWA